MFSAVNDVPTSRALADSRLARSVLAVGLTIPSREVRGIPAIWASWHAWREAMAACDHLRVDLVLQAPAPRGTSALRVVTHWSYRSQGAAVLQGSTLYTFRRADHRITALCRMCEATSGLLEEVGPALALARLHAQAMLPLVGESASEGYAAASASPPAASGGASAGEPPLPRPVLREGAINPLPVPAALAAATDHPRPRAPLLRRARRRLTEVLYTGWERAPPPPGELDLHEKSWLRIKARLRGLKPGARRHSRAASAPDIILPAHEDAAGVASGVGAASGAQQQGKAAVVLPAPVASALDAVEAPAGVADASLAARFGAVGLRPAAPASPLQRTEAGMGTAVGLQSAAGHDGNAL